nr:MAG TPA: hypothetical protein [Caudoviricetes sp.]
MKKSYNSPDILINGPDISLLPAHSIVSTHNII